MEQKRKGIIVAGTLCIDIAPQFETKKKVNSIAELLVPGKVVHGEGIDIHPGGAAANTGLGLKVLGADVTIIGKIGKDVLGDMIYIAFDQYDAAGHLIVDPEICTSYSIAINPPGLDRIFLHDPCAGNSFKASDVDPKLYETAQIFHFGYPPVSRTLYLNNGQQMVEMLQAAKAAGCATSVDMCAVDPDCESGRLDWAYIMKRMSPYVDFFEPSIEELLCYLNHERYEELYKAAGSGDMIALIDMERDVKPLADKLISWGSKVVLIKCGYKGLYLQTAGADALSQIGGELVLDPAVWADKSCFERSYKPEKVLSGTGAGDTTIAAFLYAVSLGYSLEKCLQLATATGACCVSAYDSLGGLKDFEELEEMIANGWEKQYF